MGMDGGRGRAHRLWIHPQEQAGRSRPEGSVPAKIDAKVVTVGLPSWWDNPRAGVRSRPGTVFRAVIGFDGARWAAGALFGGAAKLPAFQDPSRAECPARMKTRARKKGLTFSR